MQVYLQSYTFLLDLSFDHYVVSFFVPCNSLYFKVYFVSLSISFWGAFSVVTFKVIINMYAPIAILLIVLNLLS